jgi:hypothetical protein
MIVYGIVMVCHGIENLAGFVLFTGLVLLVGGFKCLDV